MEALGRHEASMIAALDGTAARTVSTRSGVELLPIATARYASPDEIADAARLPAWTTGTGKRAELSDRPLAHQWKILTLA
jgi:hypothetical protein